MTSGLRVLTYHRILDAAAPRRCSPSVVSATPAGFAEQMRYVASRFRVVHAEEVAQSLRSGRPVPRRALLITFDDGCRDFAEVAWPILRRLRLPVTVFVPTAYPDHPGRAFWWDRLHAALDGARQARLDTPWGPLPLDTPARRRDAERAICRRVKATPHAEAMPLVDRLCRDLGERDAPGSEVLGWADLRALAADGVSIGAHTRTHPALTQLPPADALHEMAGSAADVEQQIGVRPRVIAYPFGDHDERTADLAREAGFELALTCRDGVNRLPGDDPLRLRRTDVTRRTTPLIFRARLTALGAQVDEWRHRGHSRPGGPAVVGGGAGHGAGDRPPLKVAYTMSRFPTLSETFVLNEMAACHAAGVAVEVFPLLRERQATVHPEAEAWARRAHYHPFLSLPILAANVRFLRERPVAYLKLLAEVLAGTWGSVNFFVGALGIFPKSVRFALEMREAGVTHLHAHFATHPALAAFIVNRLTGIPFSFTAHGSDIHVDRRMLDVKVAAARFAVAVSAFNRDVIVRECGERARDKVHVVHCGVDPGVFAPARRPARPDRATRIICVASFEEVKGHRFLIEACRLLRERGVRLECHLVGAGPLRRAVEEQVRTAGLRQHVVFHGGLPRLEVVRQLAQADIAVLASHPTRRGKREGIPVALMEAMASALPVVATAISGIPELVDSEVSGLLVPSGDPSALAEALERLAGDAALRQCMGEAGRAKVMEHFNLERNARHLVALFASAHAVGRVSADRESSASELQNRLPGRDVTAGCQQASAPLGSA